MHKRWFDNPYEDYAGGNVEIDKVGLRKYGVSQLEMSLRNGGRDGDGGLYVGAIGVAYAYFHVKNLLEEEEKMRCFPLALQAFLVQKNESSLNSTRSDMPAFLLGDAGLYAVGAVIGNEMRDSEMQQENLEKYVKAAEVCKPLNFLLTGGDELLMGRTGYLFGALWLQQKLGSMPVPRKDLFDVWSSIVESGRSYSRRHHSPCPLMYSYHGAEYLGAAHGLSAILQILLSFPVFLRENPEAEKLIKDSLDYYLSLQDSNGNFPCSTDEINPQRPEEDMLIHWCHGAPGSIFLLAKAYLFYKDKRFLDASIKCGELVWRRGLLTKGPGLCHGVAGNAYVFLIIYNLLEQKDPKYLYRAVKFSEFLNHAEFKSKAKTPDNPYSLYEGSAGTACFVMDLLQPESAEFPFFNLNNNYN